MKEKTIADIQKAIGLLNKQKADLPEYSFFGDNNWALVDAQLDLIEGDEDYDTVLKNYDLTDLQESELYTARKWLDGAIDNEEFFATLE